MQPNSTNEKIQTGVKPYKNREFEDYITWRALGGLLIDEENETSPNHIRIMTLIEFCTTFKIDRKTVWNWKTQTPDLAERIERRRAEIIPLSRVSAVWNQLFLTAMQSKDKRAAVEAQKTFLGHFGNLQLPVQREEIKVGGGLADLLQAGRERFIQNENNVQEGEVIEPNPD